MKISTRGRYSLEALLYLALHTTEGSYMSIRDIAENTGVTEGYLEQLFIPLKKESLIQSIRGAQGGYQLGKNSKHIFVGDILRAVEGTLEPVACIQTKKCPQESTCITHHLWGKIFSSMIEFIDSISLQDLVIAFNKMDAEDCAL